MTFYDDLCSFFRLSANIPPNVSHKETICNVLLEPILRRRVIAGVDTLSSAIESVFDIRLEFAKICLVVGPRLGPAEQVFIQKCLPNLKSLTVVEKNTQKFSELMRNVAPDLKIIHRSYVPKWYNGPSSHFEVLLMFHIIENEIGATELNTLCRNWLKEGGSAFLTHSSGDEDKEQFHDTSYLIMKILMGAHTMVNKPPKNWPQFRQIDIERVYKTELQLDFRNPDPKFVEYIKSLYKLNDKDISKEGGLEKILERVAPDGNARYSWTIVEVKQNSL